MYLLLLCILSCYLLPADETALLQQGERELGALRAYIEKQKSINTKNLHLLENAASSTRARFKGNLERLIVQHEAAIEQLLQQHGSLEGAIDEEQSKKTKQAILSCQVPPDLKKYLKPKP